MIVQEVQEVEVGLVELGEVEEEGQALLRNLIKSRRPPEITMESVV